MSDRRLFIVIGQQRSGKSYFTAKMLDEFTAKGGFGFVYGAGNRADDWKNSIRAKILTAKEHQRAAKAQKKTWDERLHWVKVDGKFYHYSHLPMLFRGKSLKAGRSDDRTNGLFAEAAFRFFGKSFVVFDDAKGMLRHGLSSEFTDLSSMLNHVGSESPYKSINPSTGGGNVGANVAYIFHGIDHVNPLLWDYATDIIQFYTPPTGDASFAQIKNEQVETVLAKNAAWLQTAPRYSKTLYRPNEGTVKYFPAK